MILTISQIFIVLKIFVTGIIAQDGYKMVCDVKTIEGIDALPQICSALGSKAITEDEMVAILPIRKSETMPFMRVFSDVRSVEWSNIFGNDAAIRRYIETISKYKINAVCFDFMYREEIRLSPDTERSHQIVDFIKKLKIEHPLTLFGLMTPELDITLQYAFDVNVLEPNIDFYILKGTNNRICQNSENQVLIKMEELITILQTQNYDMSKVLLEVDLREYLISRNNAITWISYNEACSKPHSPGGIMCSKTLEQFYLLATLVSTYNMRGLYASSASEDDFKGNCRCAAEDNSVDFPILKVMSRAMEGLNGGKLVECETWAKYSG